ncbi:YHS domain-containing (seleno)protein [Anderseniella sp. Alg231-50]|uniref:YHS domain-containing (seleno)protein n=1 Tax=Anderseniella sp. Alg231-50 TaxID=1922226 RepID=UPI000D55B68F
MRHLKTLVAVLALVLAQFALTPAWADKAPIYQSGSGTAIDGTDPTSYFTEGRPVAGDKGITHKWNGATWRFTSTENRDRFAAAPEKYAPQFGGYCAWAVSQGYTASTVPEAWSIVDGKLYLNYSKSVQKNWEKDVPGHITSADKNWPKVLK